MYDKILDELEREIHPKSVDDRDPIYLWDLAPLIGRNGKVLCCFVMLYGLDGEPLRWELYDYLRSDEQAENNVIIDVGIEKEVECDGTKTNAHSSSRCPNSVDTGAFSLERAAEALTLVPGSRCDEALEGRSVRGLHFQEIIARRERIQRAQFLLNCRDMPNFINISDVKPNNGMRLNDFICIDLLF